MCPSTPYADRYAYNRTQGTPKAGMRLRDEAVLDEARQRGRCEWPGCTYRGPLDAAHCKTRGSGGHDTRDNVVGLCRPHHTLQESSGERGKQVLRSIIAAREARAAASPGPAAG